MSFNKELLEQINKRIRFEILTSTTQSGSGHPTSSLSGVELMSTLMFGAFFKANLDDPDFVNNDRLIFSKGHASPLFYALYAAAGKVSHDEMLSLRKFDSRLEGHPTMKFPYTEAATGSLGQGLSIGLGMALNAKYVDKLSYKTIVLLGDSEMAEGSNWEAMQLAAHYKLSNLIGVIDVNRLGQRGETMYGHDIFAYEQRVNAFGWRTYLVQDGHDIEQVKKAYEFAFQPTEQPTMIIAKTMKGKGISFLENKDGWHGKALSKEELAKAIQELGEVETAIVGKLLLPEQTMVSRSTNEKIELPIFDKGEMIATRKAYGLALAALVKSQPDLVALDAEVSNSTHSDEVKKVLADHFFEMYIAEQNMVGAAIGFSQRKKIPFVSTFAAFFTRAFDQIRMSQYSNSNVKFVGSHAGVSIGVDGSSQMGLEDIAMFRSVQNCLVLYPSDATSTVKLVQLAANYNGNVYLRTTREPLPNLYDAKDQFDLGWSKTVKSSNKDQITVVAAGITLHEAIKAYESLQNEGITIRVIDLYSIRPIDEATLEEAANQTKGIVVVEDHYPEGGIAEAVRSAIPSFSNKIYSLAVKKMPRSGQPMELLEYEEIDASAIVTKVKKLLK